MKKYNKIFKNRQILTSEEMNDIVIQINNIIGQLNETDPDKYFKISCSPEYIITGEKKPIQVRVTSVGGTEINSIQIFSDEDGFSNALNSYGYNIIEVEVRRTTTFKAKLFVSDATNGIIEKYLTVNAINPIYYGSGKKPEDIVDLDGKKGRYAKEDIVKNNTIEGAKIETSINAGENFFLFIPYNLDETFDINEVYLDSIIFPLKKLSSRTLSINGVSIDYCVYKSSGGIFEDGEFGFSEPIELVLTIL